MKYMKKHQIAITALCTAMLLSPMQYAHAEGDVTITDNGDGTSTIDSSTDYSTSSSTSDITSDNDSYKENSTTGSKGSVDNTSSGPAWNDYQNQAYGIKKDVRDLFKNLMNSINQNKLNRNNDYPGLATFGTMKLSLEDLQKLTDYYSQFSSLLDKKGSTGHTINSQFNVQDSEGGDSKASKVADTAANYADISPEDREEIMKLIAEQQGLNIGNFKNRDFPLSIGRDNPFFTDASYLVRWDLIKDGLKDSEYYLDRLAVFPSYVSNSMEDYAYVTAITDYHMSEINTQYAQYSDYTPDKPGEPTLKWELIDNSTGQVIKSDTGNYTHMRYTGVPAGDYTLKVTQHKVVTRSIRAYYDIRQYLVDTNTQTILYFYNKSVCAAGSRDNGSFVDIKKETTDEWVVQMNKSIRINNLGEVETSTTGTDRVQ